MIASGNFIHKWRGINHREPVAMIAINLNQHISSVGDLTIRVATRGIAFGGAWYDPALIGEGSVNVSEPILNADVTLASMSFSCADVVLSSTNGQKLSDLLPSYDLTGAQVTLTLWDNTLTNESDALVRFIGNIQTWTLTNTTIHFRCSQPRDWNRDFCPTKVTRKQYPNALEQTIGAPIGICLGNNAAPPLRPPFAERYGEIGHARDLICGGQVVGNAVVVDAGRGGGQTANRSRVLVSSLPVKAFGYNAISNEELKGTMAYVKMGDALHPIVPDTGDLFNNSTSGVGFTIAEQAHVTYAPVRPIGIELVPNYADNPNALLQPNNETSAALLDYSAFKRNVNVRLGDTSVDVGTIYNTQSDPQIRCYIIYRGSSNLAGCSAYLRNTVTGSGVRFALLTPSLNSSNQPDFSPKVALYMFGDTATIGNVVPKDGYSWSECRIDVGFLEAGTQSGVAEIIAVGLAVPYTMHRDVFSSTKRTARVGVKKSKRHILSRKWHQYTVYHEEEIIDNVTQLASNLYANVYGVYDATGTYTGTTSAIIERFPDLANWILQNLAGVSASNINTAANQFGSFTDARSNLLTVDGTDMVGALMLNSDIDINSALAWLASSSASTIHLSEFTNKWLYLPWRLNPVTTYHRSISAKDIIDPESGISVSMTPDSDVLSALRISYGYDDSSGSYKYESSVSASGSNAGYYYRNLRDATLTVVQNGSDAIDWIGQVTGNHTFRINAGSYDISSMLQALKGAFSATTSSVSYGTTIVAGVNDEIRYAISENSAPAVSYTAKLTAGTYASMSDLAVEAQRALNVNSAKGTWTVTWLPATKRFRFFKAQIAGQATPNVVNWDTGNYNYGLNVPYAIGAFGFDLQPANAAFTIVYGGNPGAVIESKYPVDDARFAIALAEPFDIKWQSGTNGQSGTKQCAFEPLGFDWVDDQRGINIGIARHAGWTPKCNDEVLFASADSKFGKKRTMTIEARAINDTQTARELRRRISLLMTKPRATVTFASEVLCDMQRGDVFEFDADMDAVKTYSAYGAGGSWIGRKFRVIEAVQKFGLSWHTEITAVDLTD